MKKLCIVCGVSPREVPDRYEGIGRPIKKVCRQCHANRLRGDLNRVLAEHKKKNEEYPWNGFGPSGPEPE